MPMEHRKEHRRENQGEHRREHLKALQREHWQEHRREHWQEHWQEQRREHWQEHWQEQRMEHWMGQEQAPVALCAVTHQSPPPSTDCLPTKCFPCQRNGVCQNRAKIRQPRLNSAFDQEQSQLGEYGLAP